MSAIIDKPFNWANKIVRAVFRGSPNLVTTSDLNRQIESLKRELAVLQQSSGIITSDLTYSYDNMGNLNTTGTYVFCKGVRFNIPLTAQLLAADIIDNKELRLYAKRQLVTYTDDSSKDISGAKFEDGSTQPAADHYVYTDAKIVFVTADRPNADFEFEGSGDYEYVATLLSVFAKSAPTQGNYPVSSYVQSLVVPMGFNVSDADLKRKEFKQFSPVSKADSVSCVPSADDTWGTSVQKLWNRLYSLEKRIFMEPKVSRNIFKINSGNISVNGISHNVYRDFISISGSTEDFGSYAVEARYLISGATCFIYGFLQVEGARSTETNLTISLEGQLPKVPSVYGGACLSLSNLRSYAGRCFVLALDGYSFPYNPGVTAQISGSRLIVYNVPLITGLRTYWSAVVPMDVSEIWDYAVDDTKGLMPVNFE